MCPVCGASNQCAVAATGRFDTPCWCKNVTFSTNALVRVPEEKRGKACLCPRCAALE
ncbi:MAG: cysteine-rich CWC family protein [Betaproteobacteria bacterium]